MFIFQIKRYFKVVHISIAGCFLLMPVVLMSQALDAPLIPKQSVTLDDVITLAIENSLDAFKAKRQYGVSYWEFKSFKSSRLPQVDLTLNPLTYNRSVVQRYDSELNIDVFRAQQNLNSYADVSVTQNIGATGTNFFISSAFNRLENFGASANKSFNATPVSIGLIQPIMAFNEFKWQNKTAPLEYEKAQQDFIYELQAINLKTVGLFFDWALASKQLEISNENKTSAEKLFSVGKKRYKIGAIERDDLLNLELEVYNTNTILAQNKQALQKSEAELTLFLRDSLPSRTAPELPELISNLEIDVEEAIGYANSNNPDIINLKLRKIEAVRDLDEAIKNNRFDLSLRASYGLNQQANTFNTVYGNFLEQQMVAVQFSVPILDWGERKGNIKTAKMNKEVTDIELQQDQDTYQQNITIKVNDFNLQKELVVGTLRTSEIARESYEISKKRFLSGQLDLLNLNSSRQAWQQATENYIKSLQRYWAIYYEVQQLTLYNFLNDNHLQQDFDAVLNN